MGGGACGVCGGGVYVVHAVYVVVVHVVYVVCGSGGMRWWCMLCMG